MNVGGQQGDIDRSPDPFEPVPLLKEMADACACVIDGYSVVAAYILHESGDGIRLQLTEEEVHVIGHEAICQDPEGFSIMESFYEGEEEAVVLIRVEDLLPVDTAIVAMEDFVSGSQ